MRTPSTRRRLLRATAGVGLAGSLSGCLSRLRPDAERQVSFARDESSSAASPPRRKPTERWSVETGEKPNLVDGDTVYVATDDETRAVDTTDGSERWTVSAGGGLSVVEGRVYVAEGDVVAIEGGEVRWRTGIDDYARWVVEGRGTVFVKTYYGLAGLHADTGRRRWTLDERKRDVRLGYDTVPVSDGESLAVVAHDGVYRVVDRTGLDRLWNATPELTPVVALSDPDSVAESRPTGATVRGDGLFVSTWLREYDHETAGTGLVQRFSLVDGSETWRLPTPLPVSGVAVTENSVYGSMWVPSGDPGGGVVAVDRGSGERRWSRNVGHLLSRASVADRVVVAGGTSPHDRSLDGGVYAFDAVTGETLWRVAGEGSIGGYPVGLVDDWVYFADGDGVHALR